MAVIMRHLLNVAGAVFLGLGIVGVFVPVLPTTPFLLLAAACYARGSHRLHDWLMSRPRLGEYIRRYREGRGIPVGVKAWTVGLLWVTIGYSALVVVESTALRIVLFAIAVGVTAHIVTLPPLKR